MDTYNQMTSAADEMLTAAALMEIATLQLREVRAERDKLRKENDILKARLRIADAKFARINGHEGLSVLLIPQAE